MPRLIRAPSLRLTCVLAGLAGLCLAPPGLQAVEKPPVVVEPAPLVAIDRADHVIGSGSPQSVTLEALASAIRAGGSIVFNTGGRPTTLAVTKTLTMPVNTRPVILDGGGLVTLDGVEKNQILVKDWKTELTVQRVRFINARAPKEGAAIWAEKWDGSLTVIDCVFDNCKTTETGPDIGGGAIRPLGQKHALISGCAFTNCAGSNGGAICSLGSQLTVINCSFDKCSAFGFGGGADARPKGKGMGGIGGAIYVDGVNQNGTEPRLYVSGCAFRDNWATDHAGAIFGFTREEAKNVSVFNACTFENNKVTGEKDLYLGFAGAIYTQDSDTYVLNSTFANNSCPNLGPSIFIATKRIVRIADCQFIDNKGRANAKGGISGPGNIDFARIATTRQPKSPEELYLGKPPGPLPPMPPILGNVKIALCVREASRLASDAAIVSVLLDLDLAAKKDDPRGQESKALAEAARTWVAGETQRIVDEAPDEPAAALLDGEALAPRIKGLPEEPNVDAVLKPLQKDRNARALSQIILAIRQTRPRAAANPQWGAAEYQKLKAQLTTFAATKDLSETLAKEARTEAEALPTGR